MATIVFANAEFGKAVLLDRGRWGDNSNRLNLEAIRDEIEDQFYERTGLQLNIASSAVYIDSEGLDEWETEELVEILDQITGEIFQKILSNDPKYYE